MAKLHTLAEIEKIQKDNIEDLLTSLESMNKEVLERSTKKRQQSIDLQDRKANVRKGKFSEGEYILRQLMQHEDSNKPSLKWVGPFCVI